MMATTSKKRRSGGTFNPIWELAYFFTSENDCSAKCLVCGLTTFSLRKFVLERHYKRKHHQELDQLSGPDRQAKLDSLKEDLELPRKLEADIAGPSLRASYKISLRIAKSGKPLAEGEFVKNCMMDAAELVCPTEVQQFENIKLSRQTVTRRIKDMCEDVKRQFTEKCKDFVTYSIALDESTDESDTAQLAIFVRGVDANLNVTEELLDIVPLKGTTTGADIFYAVEDCLIDAMGLSWDRLFSITTDGAPSMIGVYKGFVALAKKKMSELGLEPVCNVHCIIHQENLCAKAANIGNVLSEVIKIVNFLRAHGVNHREFKEFLVEIGAEFFDIPCHCAVRWLSRGAVLTRFFALRGPIEIFLDLKERPESKLLNDPCWVASLAFLADITQHLNVVNLSLQGRNHLITDMFDKIKAFKIKLDLWESQLKEGNAEHFPCRQSVQEGACFDQYVIVIQNLKTEFSKRFQDFQAQEAVFNLFVTPFAISPQTVPAYYRMELIDLQCNTYQKGKYRMESSLLDYYDKFPQQEFPRLHMNAAKIISMFGSSYDCESLFSFMKLTKSKFRGCLTDENLQNCLRLMSTKNFVPDIDHIIENKK